MSLADLLRNAVATARAITLPLHVTVTHHVWIGQAFDGEPDYVDVTRLALVERKQRLVKTMGGTEEMSSTYIGFIEQVAPTTPNAGFSRTNPVDVNDTFTIPDGTTINVLAVDGFFDGGTGKTFYTQVYG